MEKSILDPQMVEFVKFAKNFTSPKDPQKALELFIAKKSEYKANDLFVRVNGSGEPSGSKLTIYLFTKVPMSHLGGYRDLWPDADFSNATTPPYFMVMVNITTGKSARAIDMGCHPYLHKKEFFTYAEVSKAMGYRPNSGIKPIHVRKIGNMDDIEFLLAPNGRMILVNKSEHNSK